MIFFSITNGFVVKLHIQVSHQKTNYRDMFYSSCEEESSDTLNGRI